MPETRVLARCPSCATENRIPVERLGQEGRCGRCKAALAGARIYSPVPVEVGDGRFDLVTRRCATPVLADFWASWCAPCRLLEPTLEQLASEQNGRLLVIRVNTEEAAITASRFGIRAIPTIVLLRSGIEVERVTGVISLEALRERISPFT